MDKKTEGAGRYLLEERRTRRHWATLVVLLAILVSTGTFFVLRHNAIAATYKKRVLDCQQISGTVAHIHNDDCYDKNGLVCPLEEIAPHLHTSECYKKELVCGLEESAGHVHTEECWAEETDLVCGLDEHIHGPECYELALICGEDEALPEYDEAGELIDPGHVHTDACYGYELICEEEEHIHTESCWETSRYTVCGLEEGEGAHQHDESCYVSNLICGQEELPVHIHDANCFITVDLTPEEVEAMRAEEAGETAEGETEEGLEPAGESAEGESEEGKDTAEETASDTETIEGEPEESKEVTDKTADDAAAIDEEPSEEAIDRENYPAHHFEGEAAGLLVTVNAPAGAFPKDTRMVISPIEDENVLNAATAEVQGEVVLVQGVDISFYDADGNEIEPLLPIQVEMVPSVESAKIIPDMTEYSSEQTLVHVDNELAATVMEQEDNLTPEVRFESDSFSAYIVVYTKIEKTVLASDGNNYRITVICDPVSGIPADAALEVTEIPLDSEIYDSFRSMTEEALAENKSLAFARFFDITILADGAEVQPTGPVQVKIELANLPEETVNADTQVIHFGENTEILTPVTRDGDIRFQAESFSVYGVVYTVDFHYEVEGQLFEYSLEGGRYISFSNLVQILDIVTDDPSSENNEVQDFVNDVVNLSFSSPELLWTGKIDRDTTVGQLKADNGLVCEYSAELTEEEILAIDETMVTAPNWALISLKPFTTEETLTVTMKNGDVFSILVTDAQEIPDAEKNTIDVNKSYLICYQVGNTYYLLKNDGTVDSSYHPDFDGDTDQEHDFEHLNSTYAWSFNHIFKEQDVEHHLDKNYYLIRPIDDKSKTLTLNNENEGLVQQGNNNVAMFQNGDGFILEGYHNVGTEDEHRYIHLGFNGSAFAGVDGDGVTVHIYEMDALPTYDYTVRSADEARGTVTVSDGTLQNVTEAGEVVAHYYDATSSHDKNNAGTITATPVTHMNQGQNKWLFDHWEQDGTPLDRDQYPETIRTNSLPIPFNGSSLVAHFKQNTSYVVPNSEKEPSSFADMSEWLDTLKTKSIPLDNTATDKTAEVYDYMNRIYRVDITSKANFETFDGNVDIAFCLDVSNSMKFPSKLIPVSGMESVDIRYINDWNNWDNNWNAVLWGFDTSKTYYLISDESSTATVMKIFFNTATNRWVYTDASKAEANDINGNTKFKDGPSDKASSYKYQIYHAGDGGRNRFYYLNQALTGGTSDLVTIRNLLEVAGDQSPEVRVAYNTFCSELKAYQNFETASQITLPSFESEAGGGTRPEYALEALNNQGNSGQRYGWQGDSRYVVLITDGAPQSGSTKPEALYDTVVNKANVLKRDQGVKIITIGLSMENVAIGKQLLFDIADSDNAGDKMFYLAESASDLPNILRQIIKTIMDEATVYADVTDTVSDAFYLVDKTTGMPLKAGDTLDIEGCKIDENDTSKNVAGVVQEDGKTIKWAGQAIDQENGWHGTIYVKAKEDLIGANAAKTNGTASVKATGYRVSEDGENDIISFDDSLVNSKLKSLEITFDSPRVNVNELTFFNNETEWTVYLGTEVDPREQLKAIFDSLTVEEVVNTDGSLHYTCSPNSIEERWDEVLGTAQTFRLAPVILGIIEADPALSAKYVQNNSINWDVFLTDILKPAGITVPYHPYGIEGEDSNIVITLTKTIKEGETVPDNLSSHSTTLTGDNVEEYVLTVKYNPDYANVLPIGQGGGGTLDYHTGTFGTMYQGHATGRETSTNTHIINVYAEPLDILKKDNNNALVQGAEFRLYRVAKQGETGETLSSYDASLTGSYYCISTATSGEDGIAHMAPDDITTPSHSIPVTAGLTAQNLLVPLDAGETYYLVEVSAPSGYKKDDTVKTVTVVVGPNLYTKLDKTTAVEPSNIDVTTGKPTIAYNWYEGVTFIVNDLGADGTVNQATLVNHNTRDPVTMTDTAGNPRTYMLRSDSDQLVVTQVFILNEVITDIRIQKTDLEGNGLAGAIFQVKKVGGDGHSESDVEGIDGIGSVTKTINGKETTFTSAFETTGEEQTFTGLSDGTYRLYEVYYPAGYVVTFRYIQFTIEEWKIKDVQTDSGNSDTFDLTDANGSELALLKIKNTPGVQLPQTGGPGTALYHLLGTALMSLSGFILLGRKKKVA